MIATRARDTRNLLVALDIGTSKIVTLVAEITAEDTLEPDRHGKPSVAGPQEGRGGEHRVHGERDPALARGSRADGRR
jgi:hypothetical protein